MKAGQFSVRGSIFDIFPLTSGRPYRIDFFDEFVDSIRSFDVLSQRSEDREASIRISPARDLILNADLLEAGKAGIQKSYKQLLQKTKDDKKFDRLQLQNRMESLLEELDQGIVSDHLINFSPFSWKTRLFAGLCRQGGHSCFG